MLRPLDRWLLRRSLRRRHFWALVRQAQSGQWEAPRAAIRQWALRLINRLTDIACALTVASWTVSLACTVYRIVTPRLPVSHAALIDVLILQPLLLWLPMVSLLLALAVCRFYLQRGDTHEP